MKTKIIVNPMANKGSCGKRWPQMRAELEKTLGVLGADDVVMTNAPNHASVLAREAAGEGYRRLVSVGGDGTFNEVMNGVIANDRLIAPDLVLAQMPGGTSNELCRSFGQLSFADASRAIASGLTREIDIFRVDATSHEQGQVTRYGVVLAMIGIYSAISWRAQRLPMLKRLGPISYIIVAAITALTYMPSQYRFRIDDEAEQNLLLWSIMLCSFDGAGGTLMLAPGADPSDGKLDVVLLAGDLERREGLTRIIPGLGDGSYLAHPKVSRRHATRIKIESDRTVRADVDGESIGRLPMSLALLPLRLRVAINRS